MKYICDHAEECTYSNGTCRKFPSGNSVWAKGTTVYCGIIHKDVTLIPYVEPEKEPTPAPEYEVIKPVSIRAIIEAQGKGCDEFWNELSVFHANVWPSLSGSIPNDKILNYISTNPKALNWLLSHGFIREKVEELRLCPFCKGIDIFQTHCNTCLAYGPSGSTESEARRKWNDR
jgi:hypothetical protein